MNIGHKLLVWMGVIGITLTIIFECALVTSKLSILTIDYQTSKMKKEVVKQELEIVTLRKEAYKHLVSGR